MAVANTIWVFRQKIWKKVLYFFFSYNAASYLLSSELSFYMLKPKTVDLIIWPGDLKTTYAFDKLCFVFCLQFSMAAANFSMTLLLFQQQQQQQR